MIQLFRKFRKAVVNSSQVGKYIFYVLGEVILVVAGILIALQINNNSEYRKERQQEKVMISELKENVAANMAQIKESIGDIRQHIASIEIVQDAISRDLPIHDSLYKHLGWTMVYSTPIFNMGAYESFKMAGLDVLDDEQLRFEITDFFEYHIGEVMLFKDEIRDDFYSYMLDFLRTEFKLYTSVNRRAIPLDFEKLKENQEYQLSIGIFKDVHNDLLIRMERCESAAHELADLIEQRLNVLDDILQ